MLSNDQLRMFHPDLIPDSAQMDLLTDEAEFLYDTQTTISTLGRAAISSESLED